MSAVTGSWAEAEIVFEVRQVGKWTNAIRIGTETDKALQLYLNSIC